MSEPWRPIDGEEIVTSPAAAAADDPHVAETVGAAENDAVDDGGDVASPMSRRRGRRPTDLRVVLITAILVAALAQLVVGFLALSSINDLRNQTASANGLQHCLITAQLKQVASSNAAAYQADVRSCVSR